MPADSSANDDIDTTMPKLGSQIRLWIDKLHSESPALHLEWVAGLRRLDEFFQGKPLRIGTLYSGCDIAQKVTAALFHELNILYGFDLVADFRWGCEMKKEKQEFLQNQFEPDILFRDASDVANLFSFNEVSGEMCAVPYVDVLLAGFPCVNKSSLSSNSSSHKHCIKDVEGETGKGFRAIMDYIEANEPDWVILENLTVLTISQDSEPPEMDYIVECLNKKHYWVSHVEPSARDYGSCVVRERAYIVANKRGATKTGDLFLRVLLGAASGPGGPNYIRTLHPLKSRPLS